MLNLPDREKTYILTKNPKRPIVAKDDKMAQKKAPQQPTTPKVIPMPTPEAQAPAKGKFVVISEENWVGAYNRLSAGFAYCTPATFTAIFGTESVPGIFNPKVLEAGQAV
jgi:hypothetical protein